MMSQHNHSIILDTPAINMWIVVMVILGTAFQTWSQQPKRIYFDRISSLADTTLILGPAEDTGIFNALEIAATPANPRQSEKTSYGIVWGVDISNPDATRFEALLTPADNNKYESDIVIDSRSVVLTFWQVESQKRSMVLQREITENISHSMNNNSLAVEIMNDSLTINILAGNKGLSSIAHITLPSPIARVQWGIITHDKVDFSLIVNERYGDMGAMLDSGLRLNDIENMAQSKDYPEGLYLYLDRDNDPLYARPGGQYTLMLSSDGRGGYDIIYVDGAKINSPKWKVGMKKGHLSPTPFVNHFNVVWYDSTFSPVESECSATIADSILTINFPVLKTQLRFMRKL